MQAEYDRCVSVLNAEIELAERICAMVATARRAVQGREWIDFEPLMDSLSQNGAEFGALEQEREEAFAALAEKTGADDAAFYALAARLPADERKRLSGAYRKLKRIVFRVGIENNALMNYLAGVRGIVSDFIAAAFPDRQGKLYTRRGVQVHADMRSMVLNRQF
jgi:hypothetical protein